MVEIDAGVFAYEEDLGYSHETFVVWGALGPDAVVPALAKAAQRLLGRRRDPGGAR